MCVKRANIMSSKRHTYTVVFKLKAIEKAEKSSKEAGKK